MSHFRDPAGSRSQNCVVEDIIDGRGWNARHVRNNSLRQHCRLLAKTCLTNTQSARRLFGHVCRSSGLLTSVHPKELQVVPALVRMVAYHKKWVRDPAEWLPDPSRSPRQHLNDLAVHLFARWPMPGWFGSAWLVKGELVYLERDWFCLVAAGQGMRKLAGMPPSITTRALHLAQNAPDHLTVREALRWGQVKALGGSDELLHEVLNSRMLKDLSNDAVWSRLMEKAVAAGNFGVRNFGIIADLLVEVIRNDGWHRAEDLVSLPLGELLRHSLKFWKTMFAMGGETLPEMKRLDIRCRHARARVGMLVATRWARMHQVRDFQVDRDDACGNSTWSITELTCAAQLIAESRVMRHCVGGYGKWCVAGRTSIFSLRRKAEVETDIREEGNLTIEVNRQSRRVVQIRGKWNRWATSEELKVVRRWASGSRLLL